MPYASNGPYGMVPRTLKVRGTTWNSRSAAVPGTRPFVSKYPTPPSTAKPGARYRPKVTSPLKPESKVSTSDAIGKYPPTFPTT
jgi:hypothetical protein